MACAALVFAVPPCACSVCWELVSSCGSILTFVGLCVVYKGILIRWLVLELLGYFLFCFFVVVVFAWDVLYYRTTEGVFLLDLVTGISASRILLCCGGGVCGFAFSALVLAV